MGEGPWQDQRTVTLTSENPSVSREP